MKKTKLLITIITCMLTCISCGKNKECNNDDIWVNLPARQGIVMPYQVDQLDSLVIKFDLPYMYVNDGNENIVMDSAIDYITSIGYYEDHCITDFRTAGNPTEFVELQKGNAYSIFHRTSEHEGRCVYLYIEEINNATGIKFFIQKGWTPFIN